MRCNRLSRCFALAVALALLASPKVYAAGTAPESLHDIGVDAYLYLYPLVSMEVTRRVSTNAAEPNGLQAPPNVFANIPAYPTADMRLVVRPNFDTLYSSAWLDLTKGPVIVSAPDTNGRYYLLPMLDMWSNVFASPGWRTTGTKAGNWAVVPPGWSGTLPAGVDRIDAPTFHVWIIGRTKTDGPADYAAVHKIQAGYKLTPLAMWGKAPVAIVGTVDPSVDMKTPPKTQVDQMSARDYFAYAAKILQTEPAGQMDQPMVAILHRVGFDVGKPFDLDKADAAVREAFATVPQDSQKLLTEQAPRMGTLVSYWSMNVNTMGVYGTYYLKRAIIAREGLGANLPEDAIYPFNAGDAQGKPLDGANRYFIHFDAGKFPPARAFWSITLYDNDGFQVANPLNRFALSSYMPFVKNPDGSLDLYFQNASPGAGKEANWLPAPKGPFTLTMRLYAPDTNVLLGSWAPPAIQKQ